jgi:hypothetical protein
MRNEEFMNENIKFSSSFKKLLCRLSGNDPYEDVKEICDQPREGLAKYGCNTNMKYKSLINLLYLWLHTEI